MGATTTALLVASLPAPRSAKTRIEREFDGNQIAEIKAAATTDLGIGGPELAAPAIKAGLVDELRLFVSPIVVGGGNASLPGDARLDLDLIDEHRFSNGVVFLRYRT